jgi:hypothetical protein
MRFFRRCNLASTAALASYLLVHILAGPLHHHDGGQGRPDRLPIGSATVLRVQVSPSTSEESKDDFCALCSVLHLAQALPAACQLQQVVPFLGDAFSGSVLIRPFPAETLIRSRGPPA